MAKNNQQPWNESPASVSPKQEVSTSQRRLTARQRFTLISTALLCLALIAAMFVVPFKKQTDYYDGDYQQRLSADLNRPVGNEELTIAAGSAMSLEGVTVDLYHIGMFSNVSLDYGHTFSQWDTTVLNDDIGAAFLAAMNQPGVCAALSHSYECDEFRTVSDKQYGGRIAYMVFTDNVEGRQFIDDPDDYTSAMNALREEFQARHIEPTVQGLTADTPSVTVRVPQGHYLAIDSTGRVAMGYTLLDGMTSHPDVANLYDQTFGQLVMEYGDTEEWNLAPDDDADVESCYEDDQCNLAITIWGYTAPVGTLYRVRDAQGRLLEYDRSNKTWHPASDKAHATQIRTNGNEAVIIQGLDAGEYDLLQAYPTGFAQAKPVTVHLIVHDDGSIDYDAPEPKELSLTGTKYTDEYFRTLHVQGNLWDWQRPPLNIAGYVLGWTCIAFLVLTLVVLPARSWLLARRRKRREAAKNSGRR